MKLRELLGVVNVNSLLRVMFNKGDAILFSGNALEIPYPLTLFEVVRVDGLEKDKIAIYVEVE